MNLQLTTQQEFNTLTCDIYRDSDRNPYMTIEQLALALGYKTKNGVELILNRNPELRGKEFSVISSLLTNGKYLETRLFNEDGIMEICFLSTKPKAKEFRAWAREILKAFNHGQLEWIIQREIEKPIRRDLTDAIKDWEHLSNHSYNHMTNLVCKAVTGKITHILKKERQQPKEKAVYDILTTNELTEYKKVENRVISLLELQLPYSEISDLILNNKKRATLLPTKVVKETLN